MTNKICLLVLYNHNYESNIPRIEKLYQGRFKHIYHIMPFYTGHKKNVIPVYESSFQFSGYITQAYAALKNLKTKFSHFCIVADDIILNPILNETNILDKLNLDGKSGYINDIKPLTRDSLFAGPSYWNWSYPILMHFLNQGNACEFRPHIPSFEQAAQQFKDKGISLENMPSEQDFLLASQYAKQSPNCYYIWTLEDTIEQCLLKKLKSKSKKRYLLAKLFRRKPVGKKYPPIYPLAFGYSDLIVIPDSCMQKFCHLCGVFAAARIFVESAIPTSMVLSIPQIKTRKNTKFTKCINKHTAQERDEFACLYGNSLRVLFNNFPKDCLFVHPVKLSKWTDK